MTHILIDQKLNQAGTKSTSTQSEKTISPLARWICATGIALLSLAAPLQAQYKLCFPSTTWFGSPSGPDFNNFKVADPAWLGAFRYVFGNGTTTQYAVVQGIKDSSNNLFFSVEAEGLTSLDSTTIVVLALDFRQKATDTGPLWRIVLHPVFNPPANPPANPGSAVGAPSGARSFYKGTADINTGVVTWVQQATPTWLATNTGGSTNGQVGYWGSAGNYNWFLELQIPSTNLPVPTTSFFGTYVNIFRVVGTQYQESWWPPTSNLYEPGCAPGQNVGSCTPVGQTPPAGTIPFDYNWSTSYSWGISTIDPAQSCGGVSVGSQNNDIHTSNTPNSRICLLAGITTSDGTICPATPNVNVFTANVHNTMKDGNGTSLPAPNVRATFSIANFGLQPMWDPSQWTKVNLTNNPTTATTLTAGAANTPLSTSSWYPVQPNASLYDPVTGNPHQCILVQLDSTTGNVDFINNAAIQNMDFVKTSSFRRTAEISAKGYPPRPDNPDGTHNTDQLFDLHIITREETLNPGQAASTGNQAEAQRGQGKEKERGEVVSQLTWIAHGCRHTGRYMIVDEQRKMELCDPVGGFGYVMRHRGTTAVKKWNLRFTGSGLEPVPGQPNTYRIHVPQDGVAKVATSADPKEDGTAGRLAVFLDAGAGIPHGTFSNAFNTGFSLNAGLEYILTSRFSAEGIFGYHHFPAKVGSAVDLYQFSGNGKLYLSSSGPFRPFVNAGVGGYDFTPGGGTHFGGNVGAGVLREFGPHWGLQASYNFHAVNTPGAATKFSTVQGGIRFVF